MTETQEKALALVNEVRGGRPYTIDEAKREYGWCFQAVCRAIEQHEAFRQEVSDAITEYCGGPKYVPSEPLARFIIAKPDPIAEAWIEATGNTVGMEPLNAALAARGLKIVEDK